MDIIERTFKRIDVGNTGFITDDQLLLALRDKGASGETIRRTFALLKPYFDAQGRCSLQAWRERMSCGVRPDATPPSAAPKPAELARAAAAEKAAAARAAAEKAAARRWTRRRKMAGRRSAEPGTWRWRDCCSRRARRWT